MDSNALDQRLYDLINNLNVRQDLNTATQHVNGLRLPLDITSQNLVNLTCDLDNTKQDSNRRFEAVTNAGPRPEAERQDLSRRLDAINQDLQRRIDTVNSNVNSLGQRLDTVNQNLNRLTQRFDIANQEFDRRLHRLSHRIYQSQPCCTIM